MVAVAVFYVMSSAPLIHSSTVKGAQGSAPLTHSFTLDGMTPFCAILARALSRLVLTLAGIVVFSSSDHIVP